MKNKEGKLMKVRPKEDKGRIEEEERNTGKTIKGDLEKGVKEGSV